MNFARPTLAFLAYAIASSPKGAHAHRRLVSPDQSIAAEVGSSNGNGGNNGGNNGSNGRAKYKLQANQAGGHADVFEVNVRESTSAITSATTTSVNGGSPRPVQADKLAKILVADSEAEGSGVVAIIAVEESTGDVNGIVERGGRKVKFTQKGGKDVSSCASLSAISVA